MTSIPLQPPGIPTTHARVAVMKFESSHPHPSCPIILHPGHKWRREGTRNTSAGKELGKEDDDVHVSVEFWCRAAKTCDSIVTCKAYTVPGLLREVYQNVHKDGVRLCL
jgi:hypothetical protein